jgi:hypothetical protein
MLRRVPMVAAFFAVSLAASASTATTPSRPYTVKATEACLDGLAAAVAGLPPASPPAQPVVFIYAFHAERLPRHARGELGVWQGHNGAYEGMSLSFFKNARAARAATKTLLELYDGTRIGNVVVAWDQGARPRWSLRTTVLGCLRGAPGGTPASRPAAPQATLATFAGYWGGHTRGLRITQGGRGHEYVNAGCCRRAYGLAFRVLSVHGTVTRAIATYRVISYRRHDSTVPKLHGRRIGEIQLRNGIATNTLTRVYFCSLPAWGATGVCGA